MRWGVLPSRSQAQPGPQISIGPSVDSGAEQVPDGVGKGQAECAAHDHAHDGAADVAAAQPGAEGAGQGQSDQDSGESHRDPAAAGGSKMASIGSSAPDTNDSAEAAEAWTGLARSAGSICSSASRWAA